MTSGLRIGRRRKFARVARHLIGGELLPATGSDTISARLVEIANETNVPVRESDQAELLARLRLDDTIPPDVLAAICATLIPILTHSKGAG